MAPSFAEAFYGCGVSNFVCTAWPVDDPKDGTLRSPAQMHEAMRQARLHIAGTPAGALTWGAYQHYGNPFYRFFGSSDGDDGAQQPPEPSAVCRINDPAVEVGKEGGEPTE